MLLASLAPRAEAAAPSAPVLVSPSDNATAASTDGPLSVIASDPDGGPVSVRFEGRKKGATVPGVGGTPFTLVALPDTYSPKLNQFETDADSSFTLPFDLSQAQPAPFTTIATM